MSITTRPQIRQQIRHARRQLSATQQHTAALHIVDKVAANPSLCQANKVALYLANDGELDPYPLIKWYWQQGAQVYLPVLHPFCKGHLLFFRYQTTTPLVTNRLGIAEPPLDIRQLLPLHQLDIVYTPLVAFDSQGNRMGMGGGFYDRTLANSAHTSPRVVGLAHDCQQLSAIPCESWDIPLNELITPSHYWRW